MDSQQSLAIVIRGSFFVSSLVGPHFTSVHLASKMEETRLLLSLEREQLSLESNSSQGHHRCALCLQLLDFVFEDSKDYDAVSVDRELQ